MSLVAANHAVYDLLKGGIPVSVPDREHGGQKTERLRVIDWQQPLAGNDFLLVSQMTVTGALYTVRPDLIGFVNGLPLVVVELKKPGVPAKQAFDDNLTSYKHPQNGIPDLFWYNALLMASNGIESRVGTLTADWERFFEWKRVEREDESRRVSLEDHAPRRLRPLSPPRPRGELHAVLRGAVWPTQDAGPEPSGAWRQQGDPSPACRLAPPAMDVAVSFGTPKERGRACRWSSSRRRS